MTSQKNNAAYWLDVANIMCQVEETAKALRAQESGDLNHFAFVVADRADDVRRNAMAIRNALALRELEEAGGAK